MPNWVYTTLNVSGDAERLKAFKEKAKTPDAYLEPGCEKQDLDFNAFIPMPKEIMTTKNRLSADLGEAVYGNNDLSTLWNYHRFQAKELGADLEGPRALDAIKLLLDIVEPDCRTLGLQSKLNRDKYGFSTWYDWSIHHWGSKWNACHVETEDFTDLAEPYLWYAFDTAWSPVEPVLCAMSGQFPELTFEVVFKEECLGFHYRAVFKGGEKIEEEQLEEDGVN